MLESQCGEQIRVGKAGVQRALMAPVAATEGGKADYAMVYCPEKDIYISRDGAGQRSCTFHVMWWTDSKDDDTRKSKDFTFKERDKAIALFLKLVKKLYD